MITNSMRDELKDRVRELLAGYCKIDPVEVDADIVCSISDEAFSVCGISEKEQDEPYNYKEAGYGSLHNTLW